MTEMIIVISVIGILAGVAIVQLIGMKNGTQDTVARQKLETLNRAVAAHQESNARDNLENLPSAPGATWDELKILMQLQFRDPVRPSVGSPYMVTNYRPATSSDVKDYRIMWTGSNFRLLPPGTTGSGIKVVFDGSDIGPDIVFPPGYKWSSK